jgi:UDP-N-acetylmuramoyl-L-alanine---L-glutamate ligase
MPNLPPIIPAGTPKVAIWGYGREGRATHKFLLDRHSQAQITIINDDAISSDTGEAHVLIGADGIASLASGEFDVVIKSPGISLYRPEIAAAKANGTRFSSATNLWFEAHPQAFTVAVTGTKGKSTSASLLHYLFGLAGKRSKLLGNVGAPMLAEEPGNDVTVLELSSYQIADLEFSPSLALVTNLHPEHGPWHQGHENYYRDKMRLVTNDKTVAVAANTNDKRLAGFLNNRTNVHYFEVEQGFHVDGPDAAPSLHDGGHAIDVRNLALRGRHNWVNLAGAFTALHMAGAFKAGMVWDFASFTPLPHRLQEVRLKNGALAVNDSISTIPETTLAALNVYGGQPFRLILGGVDRGQDFTALLDHLLQLSTLRGLYLPDGHHAVHHSTGERLEAQIADAFPALAAKSQRFGSFDAAAKAAIKDARVDEAVILSPGAPSQTEFVDFEARGRRFLEICSDS